MATGKCVQALDLTCITAAPATRTSRPRTPGRSSPRRRRRCRRSARTARIYSFTIKPGFVFSPPSNEPVTAETFRATIERAPLAHPGRRGTWAADLRRHRRSRGLPRGHGRSHPRAVRRSGTGFSITLQAPAPDFLEQARASLPVPRPGKATPALRSGLNPDPPISGAGPYYLAEKLDVKTTPVVLKKNPNYVGPRAQPFDAIAIEMPRGDGRRAGSLVPDGHRSTAPMLDPGEHLGRSSQHAGDRMGSRQHEPPSQAISAGSARPAMRSSLSSP